MNERKGEELPSRVPSKTRFQHHMCFGLLGFGHSSPSTRPRDSSETRAGVWSLFPIAQSSRPVISLSSTFLPSFAITPLSLFYTYICIKSLSFRFTLSLLLQTPLIFFCLGFSLFLISGSCDPPLFLLLEFVFLTTNICEHFHFRFPSLSPSLLSTFGNPPLEL